MDPIRNEDGEEVDLNRANDLTAELAGQLDQLYSWCKARNVPLMAIVFDPTQRKPFVATHWRTQDEYDCVLNSINYHFFTKGGHIRLCEWERVKHVFEEDES